MGNLSKIGNGKAIVSLNEFERNFLNLECKNVYTYAFESELLKECIAKIDMKSDIFLAREICAFYVLTLKQSHGKKLGLVVLLGKLASGLLEVEFDLENLDTELSSIQNAL